MADNSTANDTGNAESNEPYVKPLDHRKHDRAAFSSGIRSIDNYLKLTAKKHDLNDHAKIFVVTEPDSEKVIGFYALSSHSVSQKIVPIGIARNAPNHGNIPCVFLSMIGVDKAHQGKGIGTGLLIDAMNRVARRSADVGTAAIVLDVLVDAQDDEETIRRRLNFYQNMGFEPTLDDPKRLMISIKAVRASLAAAGLI
ncbi:GNAT family N-acetyltransferase [Nisaea sediminum]|uniref:GNAT family N-acetyltransferase n=1 Tax=Nisaea sediminum TaxID=2775867 RepID=UPI001867FBE4|nr:GNAT family N-acetyltransferase [Nisaea sediminum]